MLWLERRIVAALAGADDDRSAGAISDFVDSSFKAMPAHLRLGVLVESIGLGASGCGISGIPLPHKSVRPSPGSSAIRSASCANTRSFLPPW